MRGWQEAQVGSLERVSGTSGTKVAPTLAMILDSVVRRRSPDPYVVVLAVLFALEWLVLAIRPRSREDWILENALSVAFVVALALSYRRLVLSRISYTTTLFLSVHTGYTGVPGPLRRQYRGGP